MKATLSRRNFIRSGAVLAAASAAGVATPSPAQTAPESGKPSPIHLGLASYTFRNFTRDKLIGFMKQLNLTDLNCKDTKDHLPMDPAAEAQALADYAANGIKVHAIGTVYFPKDEDDDIRGKFEYAKRAGVKVIVTGDPTPETLPRIEKFIKEYDIRIAIHNHGPEDRHFIRSIIERGNRFLERFRRRMTLSTERNVHEIKPTEPQRKSHHISV